MNKQEYKQANIDWLKAKAQEEGVKALPKGIYYKVISEGKNDGIHPTPRNVVTAHYTGWTIDGKVFDSSCDEGVPIAFRLSDLIEGWIIAMQQMCIGDKWEIYLPADKAQSIIEISQSFGIDAQIVGRVEASDKKQLDIHSEFGDFHYE